MNLSLLITDVASMSDRRLDSDRRCLGAVKLDIRLAAFRAGAVKHGIFTPETLLLLRPYTDQIERINREQERRDLDKSDARKQLRDKTRVSNPVRTGRPLT